MVPQLIYPLCYKMLPSHEGSEPARSLNTEHNSLLTISRKVITVKQFAKSALNTMTRKWQSVQSYTRQGKTLSHLSHRDKERISLLFSRKEVRKQILSPALHMDIYQGYELQKVRMYCLLTSPFFGNQLRSCILLSMKISSSS